MASVEFATVNDIATMWRPLTADEQKRAHSLIPMVGARLRTEARKVGRDLDKMVEEDESLTLVAKSVVVDIVSRTLMTSTKSEPMSQFSQSALGYAMSGTYLNPGGGIFIKKSELSALGLRRQRRGTLELYDTGNPGSSDL